jgi:hypothetical protein
MNVFPATMMMSHHHDNDLAKQTDDLVHLFSTTLQSLASDAAAVRQITSLANVSGVVLKEDTDDEPKAANENELQGLSDLDQLVAGLEEKVGALRQIVAEEKRALQKFETTLHDQAQEQAAVLQELLQVQTHQQQQQQQQQGLQQQGLQPPFSNGRRDSVDPRTRPSNGDHPNEENTAPVSLPRITQEEFLVQSRNPIGRISLMDLNEALQDIETVCVQKWAASSAFALSSSGSSNRTQPSASSSTLSSNALQRRHDYLQRRQGNEHILLQPQPSSVDGGGGGPQPPPQQIYWVSEQDLREHCAFFRHGESTARATLSVLCSLRRLKQTPGKRREVTYICLTKNDNEGDDDDDSRKSV